MTPKPTSELYLLANVELDPEYNFTIDFDNAQAQHTYFEAKVSNVLEINEGYSFIRDNEALKVYADIEDLQGVNYLMYKNKNRWYYAFITHKEYVGENVTRLNFKLDVFQTFMFDYEMQESYIDREHQDRWEKVVLHPNTTPEEIVVPKYNRVTENIEIGKNYFVNDTKAVEPQYQYGYYVIKSKEPLGKRLISSGYVEDELQPSKQGYGIYGITAGVYVYIVQAGGGLNDILIEGDKQVTLFGMSNNLYQDPRVIEIKFVKYLPDNVMTCERKADYKYYHTFKAGYIVQYDHIDNEGTASAGQVTMARVTSFGNGRVVDFALENFRKLNTLPSKDNFASIDYETKLLTYPYSYFRVIYGTETFDFYRENFKITADPTVSLFMSIGLNTKDVLTPEWYNGSNIYKTNLPSNMNVFEMQQLTKSFDITLRTDKWQEYELNNKASMNGGLIAGAVQTVASIGLGVATGGIGLAVAGGQALNFAGQVANDLMKREDIKNTPDNVRPSLNDTLLTNSLGELVLKVDEVSIYDEFKQNVYKYFQHYGYKASEFKKPNTRSRYYYNYIKIIGVNLKTNIDSDFKNELASIFNNGITIWHYRNATTFKGVNNFDYENVEMNLIQEATTNGN